MRHLSGNVDLLFALGLGLMALLAALLLPDGSTLRILLVLPVLFGVPGYLLLQAAIVGRGARWFHVLLGVGISPAVVGLAAFTSAMIPGGFRPAVILTMVTVTCVALAAVSLYRRSRTSVAAADHDNVVRTSS